MFRAEQRDQRDVLRAVQQIDGRGAVARAPGVIGDQSDPLAHERRKPLGPQHVEPVRRRRQRGRRSGRGRRSEVAPGIRERSRRCGQGSSAVAATVATRARSGVTSPLPSGCTRFDRNTTNRPVAGSIQRDVPVKPVWPNDPIGSSSPRLAEYAESKSQPSARTLRSSPGVAGVVILATVSGDEDARTAETAAPEQHPAEHREIGGRAEQAGVSGHARPCDGRWDRERCPGASSCPARRMASRTACSVSVGATRGCRPAGGLNIVSFMPSGAKISFVREAIERRAADRA